VLNLAYITKQIFVSSVSFDKIKHKLLQCQQVALDLWTGRWLCQTDLHLKTNISCGQLRCVPDLLATGDSDTDISF
jgi:hypothetical protein